MKLTEAKLRQFVIEEVTNRLLDQIIEEELAKLLSENEDLESYKQDVKRSIISKAKKALERDFKPISDMRASSLYRMEVAKNLLEKFCAEIKHKKTIGVYF